jgi:hypothetical protein
MMAGKKTALCALVLLGACSGNPFLPDPPVIPGDLPPGTTDPSPDSSITRYEPLDRDEGNGFATDIRYDKDTDRFFVDNLAFDGDNGYKRSQRVPSLGPFQVYEGKNRLTDPQSGVGITQFVHRAVRGESRTGSTNFAIVRTGSYVDYGFGGFVYERNGGVSIPNSGQAVFRGDYAGLRDFKGRGGFEYVRGKMEVAIDFEDFDDGEGVTGSVTNRRIFNSAGQDITNQVIAGLSSKFERNQTRLPILTFDVGPGVLDRNGELTGEVGSNVVNGEGVAVPFERGTYYGVLAGDNATELAGVIVVEAQDGRADGITVRETGGFILYRPNRR